MMIHQLDWEDPIKKNTVLASSSLSGKFSWERLGNLGLSDHFPTIYRIKFGFNMKTKGLSSRTRNFKKVNWENFSNSF